MTDESAAAEAAPELPDPEHELNPDAYRAPEAEPAPEAQAETAAETAEETPDGDQEQ